jgi:hypothetical protein
VKGQIFLAAIRIETDRAAELLHRLLPVVAEGVGRADRRSRP